MRILHILNSIEARGNGIVNVAIDLACLQAAAGHEVAVASGGGEYETLLARYGVRHVLLEQRRRPLVLIRAVRTLRTLFREWKPDVVHAHMMTGIALAKIAGIGANQLLVSTVHNEFQQGVHLMGIADRVIAVSAASAESLRRRNIGAGRIYVVPNGTLGSPRTQALKDYTPAALQRPSITTVAGLYHRKGVPDLLEAFERIAAAFPDVHLYIVGDGPSRDEFRATASKSPHSARIHFEGYQREPQRYLLASDIFVLVSHRDPSPLVIPEAREAGCAVVGTAVDGIPEALDFGAAGLLVPDADPAAIADALRSLLGDPGTLSTWRHRAASNLEAATAKRVSEDCVAVYAGQMEPTF